MPEENVAGHGSVDALRAVIGECEGSEAQAGEGACHPSDHF